MPNGGLSTKSKKIIAAGMGLLIVMLWGVIMFRQSMDREYEEQAVMAENYLSAGNYEASIKAYEKALQIKDSHEELLTIGLADAYIGTGNYEKALEVLRACYKKTSGTKLKEKIEEVIWAKTDYEYTQSVFRAEVYYAKEEYKKAIAIFEEAKLKKSKDPTAYRRITEAYMAMGEYELARDEILEGLELTGDDSLNLLLIEVNANITGKQYDALLAQASEFILQENYEDAITRYEAAIKLLPENSEAYEALGGLYLDIEQYEPAIQLLHTALQSVKTDELSDLLSQAETANEQLKKNKKKIRLQ